MTTEIAKLETDVVLIAGKVKAAVEDAGNDAVKLAAWLQNNSAEITSLATLAGPQATSVAAVGLTLTNLAVTAVKSAGSAAGANAVNVTLDSEALAAVKALIAAIEKV
jgi:hypothetical protein